MRLGRAGPGLGLAILALTFVATAPARGGVAQLARARN